MGRRDGDGDEMNMRQAGGMNMGRQG